MEWMFSTNIRWMLQQFSNYIQWWIQDSSRGRQLCRGCQLLRQLCCAKFVCQIKRTLGPLGALAAPPWIRQCYPLQVYYSELAHIKQPFAPSHVHSIHVVDWHHRWNCANYTTQMWRGSVSGGRGVDSLPKASQRSRSKEEQSRSNPSANRGQM